MIQIAQTLKEVRGRRKRSRQPMDVALTVSFRFGDQPDDAVTLLNQQNVPMVGSVFDNRDRIMRGFLKLLFRAGLKQPKILRKTLPFGRTKAK